MLYEARSRLPLLRTSIFILGILILGYATCSAVRFLFLLQSSRELVRKSRVFEQRVPQGSPRILVLGDSTAVGTGVEDPLGSIAGRFGRDFPDAYIENHAVNGMKVGELDDIFPSVPNGSFDLVLLQIGANDIIRRTPMDAFSASLNSVFAKSRRAGKHVVALHSGNIGLAPMFPWPASLILTSRTRAYRDVYRHIAAERGVVYVDLFEEAKNDPFRMPGYYALDQLHLTDKGYGYWYAQIRKTIHGQNIEL